jgi:TPR repeat protein
MIIATMREGAYERYKPQGDIRPPGRDVTDLAHIVDFSGWDAIDRRRARQHLVSEVDVMAALDHGMSPSQYLSAGPDLVDRLERGNPARHGVAVVHAAADWFRAGLSRPVPLRVVRSLYPSYLPADDAELVGRFDEALDWACQPTSGVRIITRRTDGTGLVVHDYVLDYLSATLPPRLPSSTWETIADELTATNEVDDLAQVGATAYLLYDAPAIGESITRRAAERGSFGAMSNLANLLANRGHISEAEHWYVKAHEAGQVLATYNFGILRHEQDRIEEAEQLYRVAAANADPQAMTNLGNILADRGETSEAQEWWRQAAARGVEEAMFNLGRLAKVEGRPEEAERWWRAAAQAGDPDAMNSLGVLLSNNGMLEEAQRWWVMAAKASNADAMNNLGNLLVEQGEFAEAERLYRAAAKVGNAPAMNGLAVLLGRGGRNSEAERWFREAASAGDIDAMKNLGQLLVERGETQEADQWFERAKLLHGDAN